ncbi:hypothetical protein CYMTET_34726, partial [Cymbomonas tetramitiformis]
ELQHWDSAGTHESSLETEEQSELERRVESACEVGEQMTHQMTYNEEQLSTALWALAPGKKNLTTVPGVLPVVPSLHTERFQGVMSPIPSDTSSGRYSKGAMEFRAVGTNTSARGHYFPDQSEWQADEFSNLCSKERVLTTFRAKAKSIRPASFLEDAVGCEEECAGAPDRGYAPPERQNGNRRETISPKKHKADDLTTTLPMAYIGLLPGNEGFHDYFLPSKSELKETHR